MNENVQFELFPRAQDLSLLRNYSVKDSIQTFFSFLKVFQHGVMKMGFLDDIDVV